MDFAHTDSTDALLARYVAGALPLPAQVLVEAHLELKPDNRSFVGGLEELAGLSLESIEPIALDRHRKIIDRIIGSAPAQTSQPPKPSRAGIFPSALRDFVGMEVDEIPWRTKLPGLREYDIGEIDGVHSTLFWIRPGRRIPSHTHTGSELTLVIDGAFSDTRGRYGRGDIAVADETVDHRPTAEADRPCISFAVTDGPLRLTGRLHQRLSDILGA